MLHHRVVRAARGWHQYAPVDAAFDSCAKRVNGIGLGNKVGVLDPDALARQANGSVMQDLYAWRGVLWLCKHGVDQHIAGWVELRKDTVAKKQLAGLAGPVLAEGALQAMDERPVRGECDVTTVLLRS